MNIEEVEEPETTRIATKNEHPRSWRAERAIKYEFYLRATAHAADPWYLAKACRANGFTYIPQEIKNGKCLAWS